MKNTKFRMSFSVGGLFLPQSIAIAEVFLQLNDWQQVKEKVFRENILQARKISTAKRHYSEIVPRLKVLEKSEIEALISFSAIDQNYLLWVAACRRYEFIRDFAVEVLKEYYITGKKYIQNEDFEMFYERKSEWHPELELIKPKTRQKIRQVLFKMMREAAFISSKNQIEPTLFSNSFLTFLSQNDYRDINVFPVLDSTLERINND